MNIIFLDILGVLITHKYMGKGRTPYQFDPESVGNLLKIIEEIGAGLVITSSFKRNKRLVGFKDWLRSNYNDELIPHIVGLTPDLGGNKEEEIFRWLAISGKSSRFKTEKFIIIDDENKMVRLAPYLVQTSPVDGITANTRKQAIECFNRQGPNDPNRAGLAKLGNIQREDRKSKGFSPLL